MKKKYYFTFRAIKNITIVFAVLFGTIYFMNERITKVLEISRDRKSKASGLEYFVKKFKFYKDKQAYNLAYYKDKAIVLNYLDDINSKDSVNLVESQKKLIQKLEKKNIVFLYISNSEDEMKLDNYFYNKIFFLYDKNLTHELLGIKKYPYSLIFDYSHKLIGKVEAYQDWDTKEKTRFINNLIFN